MGASGLIYAEITLSQELIWWINAHVRAFAFLGGCPQLVICDHLLSGVTKVHRYEPLINATYQEMAVHYGVAILPARAYKPRDKAQAESAVLVAQRWILARLRNELLVGVAEANLALKELLTSVHNRPFKALTGSRRSVFEEIDRPALRPLPTTPYDFATWRTQRVTIDYHIEVRADRHCYPVPYRFVGEKVDIGLRATTVESFHASQRIASHVRRPIRVGVTTDQALMAESHRRHRAGLTVS
jgi:transposase